MNIQTKIRHTGPEEGSPRPIVLLPRQAVPGPLIAVVGLVAAILLFLYLDAQRRTALTRQSHDSPAEALAPPPPLAVPAEPPVEVRQPVVVPAPFPMRAFPPQAFPAPPLPPPPIIRPLDQPPPPMRSAEGVQQSDSHPALVVDFAAGAGKTESTGNRTTLIAAGTLIPAVLETPIDTAKPGLVRAIVSQDTRGFDGKKVLVPRGSRLTGEYQSDVRLGQNRVLVNWTRLVRPDGVAITIASPAADTLGGAGIPGAVHSFFFERLLDAALQTAATVAGGLVGNGTTNTVIVGAPPAAGAVGGLQGTVGSNERRPKITVKQGAEFNVFISRDLDVPAFGVAQ